MSFFGVTNITAFILGTIFIVLLPGPNSLFVLTVAIKRGHRMGFLGACGVFVGDGILMILTALGAVSVLQTHEILYNIVRFGGALYLSWIGLQLIIGGVKKWQTSAAPHQSAAQQLNRELNQAIAEVAQQETQSDLPHPFYRALIISLLNPKAIFFFLSFFVQFIDPAYPNPAVPFLLQALIVQMCSAMYLIALIFFGYRLAHSFNTHYRVAAGLNVLVGSLFCGYGARLAMIAKIN